LENAVNHAVILSNGGRIEAKHLPKFIPDEMTALPAGSLAENERQMIIKVLNESKWNKHQAAKRLQISRSTLYSKIKRYQIRK
jgi:transcriptional regulator of acetoin/glycerol metabolism